MIVKLYDFESGEIFCMEAEKKDLTEREINEKYEKGEARIVTEQGAIKLPLINSIFDSNNYEKMPVYQRRITWGNEKRSKLIESFIINIPVPPIFIYEVEFGKYEVMDGLQRVSAIQDFYKDEYALEGLTEWSELNGMKYSQLPQKVKEGIDRRQISVITLLKESARDTLQAQKMKRMVFERLNTGGVKLQAQEIRNALYDGKFNQLCKNLSENSFFREMWDIPSMPDKIDYEATEVNEEIEFAKKIAQDKLYMRMYDVELVLRFFAMRHLEEFTKLSDFLDAYLIFGNNKIKEHPEFEEKYKQLFCHEINKAYRLFGKKAFCIYSKYRGRFKWSSPNKMIYDPLMLALADVEIDEKLCDCKKNVEILQSEYSKINSELFDGKRQSKSDIKRRRDFYYNLFNDITGVKHD